MSGFVADSDGESRPWAALVFTFWFSGQEPAMDILANAIGHDTAQSEAATDMVQGNLRIALGGDTALLIETCDLVQADRVRTFQFFGMTADDFLAPGHEGQTLVVLRCEASDASPVELVKAMSRMAMTIARNDGCVAVSWEPAASAMGRDYFVSVVGHWLDGGPFPALGLTTLHPTPDGGLKSRGLGAIRDQELVVMGSREMSDIDRAKVAIRFIDHVIATGPVKEHEAVEIVDFGPFEVGPDESGENIYLKRSPMS